MRRGRRFGGIGLFWLCGRRGIGRIHLGQGHVPADGENPDLVKDAAILLFPEGRSEPKRKDFDDHAEQARGDKVAQFMDKDGYAEQYQHNHSHINAI